jgi:carbonic anhydrase
MKSIIKISSINLNNLVKNVANELKIEYKQQKKHLNNNFKKMNICMKNYKKLDFRKKEFKKLKRLC